MTKSRSLYSVAHCLQVEDILKGSVMLLCLSSDSVANGAMALGPARGARSVRCESGFQFLANRQTMKSTDSVGFQHQIA